MLVSLLLLFSPLLLLLPVFDANFFNAVVLVATSTVGTSVADSNSPFADAIFTSVAAISIYNYITSFISFASIVAVSDFTSVTCFDDNDTVTIIATFTAAVAVVVYVSSFTNIFAEVVATDIYIADFIAADSIGGLTSIYAVDDFLLLIFLVIS